MGTPTIVMTIGGSDSGAGAGIQADLKTISAQGCFATTVITTVTAQNTRQVESVQPMDASTVQAQLEALLSDLPPAATKTGLLGSVETVQVVADIAARLPNLVVDPVLVNRQGQPIVDDKVMEIYLERLIPTAVIATPNLREASLLARSLLPTGSNAGPWQLAETLTQATGTPILVTGGRSDSPLPIDVLADGTQTQEMVGRWVRSRNVHGSGDALSASIAVRLAKGASLLAAVAEAKAWVARAVAGAAGWHLGQGEGPIDHFGWA